MAAKSKFFKMVLILVAVVVVAAIALGLYVKSEWPHHTSVANIEYSQKKGAPLLDSIARGCDFLRAHQEADGNFVLGGLSPRAAWTAIAADALMKSPMKYNYKDDEIVRRALAAVVASQKPDGGLYSKIPYMSFSNYSTSLCIVALKASGNKEYDPIVAKAVEYLRSCQFTGEGDSNGGAVYDPGAGKPDGNNTVVFLEALEAAGVPKDDNTVKTAVDFVSRTQNNRETNPRKGATLGNDGGFTYGIDRSPAGTLQTEEGKPYHASYGTMSYAGLISFLYADVDKDDPRVKSAWKWVCNNYDLDVNVNMKRVGLFYYYRIMAKALQRYGERYVVTPDGVKHDWTKELSDHVMSMQREDGSWINSDTTYFEGDSILVTSYAIRVLSICHEEMEKYKSAPVGR